MPSSFLLKIFVLLLVVTSANSALAKKTITTMGAQSCEKWLENKQAAALARPTELKWVPVQNANAWLAGYVTGFNENYSAERDLLDLVDFSVIEDWIDTYCKKNPMNSVRLGVHKLFDELEKLRR